MVISSQDRIKQYLNKSNYDWLVNIWFFFEGLAKYLTLNCVLNKFII